MRILMGVDGSPFSRAAMEFVRNLQWPVGSEVIVMSAVRVPVMVSAEMYVPATGGIEQLLESETKLHQEMVSDVEKELRLTGLKTKARVLQGDPRDAIVRAAREEGADLIVVGSHGRLGLAKLLMGSVAAHVVSHAPCSVMVVKMRGGEG